MSNLQKPGEKPASSGPYVEVGPRGGKVAKPREINMEPGDNPLPPTQKPNRKWKPKTQRKRR